MTSHVIAYRSLELLFDTHTFNFNCFFYDFNCLFTQIRCLSRVLNTVTNSKNILCFTHLSIETVLLNADREQSLRNDLAFDSIF